MIDLVCSVCEGTHESGQAAMTEAELKHEVLAYARQQGWRVKDEPMVKPRRPSTGTGYPDLTCARNGQVLWIELKQEDGVLSKEQMGWMLELSPRCHTIRPSDLQGRVQELLS